jgi:hypothetical protein
MSAMHWHGMQTAVLQIGLIDLLSSASLVSFHSTRPFLIFEYEALLADFGFARVEHSINDPAKGARIFWLARAVHNCQIS